jgi:hypothetical protein
MNPLSLSFLILSLTVFFITAIWFVAKKIRKPRRKEDLARYWDSFAEPSSQDIWGKYQDGIHVHKKYCIRFAEIGCRDQESFRLAALNCAKRSLDLVHQAIDKAPKGDRSELDELNELAVQLLADIAKLALEPLSKEGRSFYANKFITTSQNTPSTP